MPSARSSEPRRISPATRARAVREMVARSRTGAFAYAILMVIVGAASGIAIDAPLLFGPLLGWQLAIAVARLRISRDFETRHEADPRQADLAFGLVLLAAGLGWGGFSAALLVLWPKAWTSMLLLVGTAGIMAGGSSTYCLRPRLHVAWLLALGLPTAIGCLARGTGEGLAMAAACMVFLLFMVRQGRMHGEALWMSLERAQLLRNANRLKRLFLANISHEIRTPMTGILGMTQALLRDERNQVMSPKLRVIQESSRTLLRLVEEILDMSRIEAGRVEIRVQPFTLATLVEQTADVLSSRAEEKGLEVVVAMDPEAPQVVVGDPDRVRQVLTNLLDNAIKFTRRGEVRIVVRPVEPTDEHPLRIAFAVEDTGVGIPPTQLHGIFQAFEQGGEEVAREHGGTGLGLTISAHLVRLMGGHLQVESRIGQGSCFEFTLPFFEPAPAPEWETAPPPEAPKVDTPAPRDHAPAPVSAFDLARGPRHFLLVTSQPELLALATRRIEGLGHRVSEALSAEAAVRIAKAHAGRIDAVLLDAAQDGDPDAVAEEIRGASDAAARLPMALLGDEAQASPLPRMPPVDTPAFGERLASLTLPSQSLFGQLQSTLGG